MSWHSRTPVKRGPCLLDDRHGIGKKQRRETTLTSKLSRVEAAYTEIGALEQEVAAGEAQRARFGVRAAESIS